MLECVFHSAGFCCLPPPACSAAWGKLSAMPAVERLVASSKVQVDAAYGKYKAAHDALVVSTPGALRQPHGCATMARHQWLLSAPGFLRNPACPRSGAWLPLLHLVLPPPRPAAQADPRYGAAVAKGGELLASLQATAAYKAAWTRLTPLLGLPAAQSAAKIAAPYVTAVAGHLAPVAA